MLITYSRLLRNLRRQKVYIRHHNCIPCVCILNLKKKIFSVESAPPTNSEALSWQGATWLSVRTSDDGFPAPLSTTPASKLQYCISHTSSKKYFLVAHPFSLFFFFDLETNYQPSKQKGSYNASEHCHDFFFFKVELWPSEKILALPPEPKANISPRGSGAALILGPASNPPASSAASLASALR